MGKRDHLTYYTFHFDNGWDQKTRQNLNNGLVRMVLDIHNMAVHRAPVRTGALINSGRYKRTGPLTYQLTFGNARVPYAVLRENVNHLHPWTTHYLGNSVDEAAAHAGQYFKDLL